MIGQEIATPRPFPLGTLLWGLAAIGIVIVAVATREPLVALGAVLPASYSVALWWSRPPAFVARLTDEGIELEHAATFVSYASLQDVSTPDEEGQKSFPVKVFHDRGYFTIPENIDAPSRDVYHFLLAQFEPRGDSRQVSPVLADYFERQEETFGPDKVWVFRAGTKGRPISRGRRGRVLSLASVATGIIWSIVGALDVSWRGWLGAGLALVFLGGLFFLLFWLVGYRSGPRLKNWKKSCLVISPLGIALVQGDLRGEMRWEELRDVKYRPRAPSFALTPADVVSGIALNVEGATIFILDIYHRPLKEIYNRIMDYWD
jgi:hypothetical protein